MLVYGTEASTTSDESDVGATLAAYDYRAFGEMIELTPPPTGKVTENFTGKEHDDDIALDYFGARYLDPMLGMWISVDPKRQFASPYLYAGNGMNPVNGIDPDGNEFDPDEGGTYVFAVFNQRRSKTNTFRFLRAYNDKTRLYRFFNTKGKDGVTKIEKSSKPNPNYKETYDVYIPFESFNGGINGKENFTDLTEILIGHELDHPYEWAKAGHNAKDDVHFPDAYFESIKNMSTEPDPDPIYLDDYKAADEMGVYDE